jgi:hypothetical protein
VLEEGFNKDFKTLLVLSVANLILVLPTPTTEPGPPEYWIKVDSLG